MAEIGRSALAALVLVMVARAGFVHPADRCTALVEATLWALVAIRTVNKSGWCNARCKPDEQQRRLDEGRSGDARSGPEQRPEARPDEGPPGAGRSRSGPRERALRDND